MSKVKQYKRFNYFETPTQMAEVKKEMKRTGVKTLSQYLRLLVRSYQHLVKAPLKDIPK